MTILLVDDHPLMRIGMKAVIQGQEDMTIVGEAKDGNKAIQLFRRLHPDVVLMDLRMPGKTGVEATAAIVAEFPQARVLLISNYDGDEDISQAMDAGAAGYLFKSIMEDEMLNAIRQVHAGKRYLPRAVTLRLRERTAPVRLTQRENDILSMLGKGFSNKELANVLGVSADTVKTHLKNLFRKLNVSDRAEAMREAIHRGFLHLD
ncbi:Response regulator receiver [Verrucomicrobia bacterium]|nr:Response regulator receiver [Verrucomicrobiota bacterium]